MPVDPTHKYVEQVHPKTSHLASEGWVYGCHSSKVGTMPRGTQTAYKAHPWNVNGPAWVITDRKEKVIDALGSGLNAVAKERDELRAKIAAMEKQEPVATVIKEGDSRYWMSERLWTFPD